MVVTTIDLLYMMWMMARWLVTKALSTLPTNHKQDTGEEIKDPTNGTMTALKWLESPPRPIRNYVRKWDSKGENSQALDLNDHSESRRARKDTAAVRRKVATSRRIVKPPESTITDSKLQRKLSRKIEQRDSFVTKESFWGGLGGLKPTRKMRGYL
ncbi:MAG: hypothetical protein Q9167_003653 [Letrouitia subvulpina]